MATIKDIAAYCDVAVSTVSRVMNNHPDVSEDTRSKVLAAARKLHYVPNNSARDLAASQTDAVGLVVRGAENPFFTRIIRSIERSCADAGCTMVLHQIPVGADEIERAATLVQSKRLRGLILLGGRYDYTSEEVSSLRVPYVCCTYTNHFGDLSRESFSSVSINDKAEAYRATKYLIDHGHQRIAVLLDSIHDRSISERRYKGYCEALADANIALDEHLVFETGEFSMEAAYKRCSEYLSSKQDFTAIFAVADSMAIAAMKALSDAGLAVPHDCSIIAIDGIEMSLYTVPTLTTLVQPQSTLGEEAVRILRDVLSGATTSGHIRLETTLRAGGTVGHAH
ncbi:MAG: LacI family DNA-binding transcriptional regulator [Atopobiaceae bacterium]|nr:LacI family DNA-binding transcriptional regulator [Atopobiaceae bacterium]